MKNINIFIIGAGCWGITLAEIYAQKNYNVCLWEPIQKQTLILTKNRQLQNFSFIKL